MLLFILVVCKTGRYRNVNTQTCDECPKGRYKEDIGNDQCLPCGTFRTTVSVGSMAADDCGEHLETFTKTFAEKRIYTHKKLDKLDLGVGIDWRIQRVCKRRTPLGLISVVFM